MRINDPDLPTVNLAVAFKGASWTDPDSVALMVMQTLLGAYDKNTGAGACVGLGKGIGERVSVCL